MPNLDDFANIVTILSFIFGLITGSFLTIIIIKINYKFVNNEKKVNKHFSFFHKGNNKQEIK